MAPRGWAPPGNAAPGGMPPPYTESHAGPMGQSTGMPALHPGAMPHASAAQGPMGWHPGMPAHQPTPWFLAAPRVVLSDLAARLDTREFHEDLDRAFRTRHGASEFEQKYAWLGAPGQPLSIASPHIAGALRRMHDELNQACHAQGFHPPSRMPSADLAATTPRTTLSWMVRNGVHPKDLHDDLRKCLFERTMKRETFNAKYGNVLKHDGAKLDVENPAHEAQLSELLWELGRIESEVKRGPGTGDTPGQTSGLAMAYAASISTPESDAHVFGVQLDDLDVATLDDRMTALYQVWRPDETERPGEFEEFCGITASDQRLSNYLQARPAT